MTTSPNVPLYAAIDGRRRRQMVEHGTTLLQNALDLANQLRQQIGTIPGRRPRTQA
jgi:arginine decarboxylase